MKIIIATKIGSGIVGGGGEGEGDGKGGEEGGDERGVGEVGGGWRWWLWERREVVGMEEEENGREGTVRGSSEDP